MRERSGWHAPVHAIFAATAVVPSDAPGPIKSFKFEDQAGASIEVPPGTCATFGERFDACGELLLNADKVTPIVTAKFDDGSALCDNIRCQVIHCSPDPRLEILPTPKRAIYDPDRANSSVNLRVRLVNASRQEGDLRPCPFLLRGQDILSCKEDLELGELEDTKTTTFGLAHCSRTRRQSCQQRADCRPPACEACETDETCLVEQHCSSTVAQKCETDADCDSTGDQPACPACKQDEVCIRFLPLPGAQIFLLPGESIDLLNGPVKLRNEFSGTAKMTDTWTVNITIPEVSEQAVLKYRIRGRPR